MTRKTSLSVLLGCVALVVLTSCAGAKQLAAFGVQIDKIGKQQNAAMQANVDWHVATQRSIGHSSGDNWTTRIQWFGACFALGLWIVGDRRYMWHKKLKQMGGKEERPPGPDCT